MDRREFDLMLAAAALARDGHHIESVLALQRTDYQESSRLDFASATFGRLYNALQVMGGRDFSVAGPEGQLILAALRYSHDRMAQEAEEKEKAFDLQGARRNRMSAKSLNELQEKIARMIGL